VASVAAQAAFTRHARRYGTWRLRAELHAKGHAIGSYALQTWLRRHGLRALSPRSHQPRTTQLDPAAGVAENSLLDQLRQPAPGLIIHADLGSQYTRAVCRVRIARAGALPSFSRPGNPYDNAQAEAGWSTLKTELLPPGSAFASLEEAHLEIVYYLDIYFNLDHRHSALGYRSPHQFEQHLKTTLS